MKKKKKSFPFWCVDGYQEVRTDHNEISTRTVKRCGGRKCFWPKVNDLGWVSWAMSQKPKPKPRHWQGIKKNLAFAKTDQRQLPTENDFRSECVCVWFFSSSCRFFVSFRPHSRFVAWFGASKLKIFFSNVFIHFFLYSHTLNCGMVWCQSPPLILSVISCLSVRFNFGRSFVTHNFLGISQLDGNGSVQIAAASMASSSLARWR